MPHISQLASSRFLSQSDCVTPILVTIKECHQEDVAKEDEAPEKKWCLSFHEVEKSLVLNLTNGELIAEITGSENTDDWIGHKIVLFVDPSVKFGKKKVGGVRARAPRNQSPAQPSRPAQRPRQEDRHVDQHGDSYQPGTDEDVPF